jgi:hypothetical protein
VADDNTEESAKARTFREGPVEDFGFWICDFGLKTCPSNQNHKSKIQNESLRALVEGA